MPWNWQMTSFMNVHVHVSRIYLSKFKLYDSYRMNCDINDFELRPKVDSVINRLKRNACIGSKNWIWKQQLNVMFLKTSKQTCSISCFLLAIKNMFSCDPPDWTNCPTSVVVYDWNHYFCLGPIPKLKPELVDTFGRYRNQYWNHILKGESSYR